MKEKILKNVRLFREKANLSQEYIAEKMNISQAKYARFERGSTKTDLDMLLLFCNVINVPIMDIITYPDRFININEIPSLQKEETVLLSIEIKKDKRDQVLKLVFGDHNLEIFNR